MKANTPTSKGYKVGDCSECGEPVYGSKKLRLRPGQRLICMDCIGLAQLEGKEVIKTNEKISV